MFKICEQNQSYRGEAQEELGHFKMRPTAGTKEPYRNRGEYNNGPRESNGSREARVRYEEGRAKILLAGTSYNDGSQKF